MCTLKPIDLNNSCYSLFFILKIFNKANPLHNISEYVHEELPQPKKDREQFN